MYQKVQEGYRRFKESSRIRGARIRLKKVPDGQVRVWISEGLRRFKNKGSKRLKKVSSRCKTVSRRFKNKGC